MEKSKVFKICWLYKCLKRNYPPPTALLEVFIVSIFHPTAEAEAEFVVDFYLGFYRLMVFG